MERLTRIELEDYVNNSGITQLQEDILRRKYFDKDEPSVIAICEELHISESKFYRNQKKLLNQIYKYENSKK